MTVVFGVYMISGVLLALVSFPIAGDITGNEGENLIGEFHKLFIFSLNNIISMGFGTYEASSPLSQYVASEATTRSERRAQRGAKRR